MELRHSPTDTTGCLPHPLATEIDTAETMAQRALGLMFQWSIPDEYALAFRFSQSGPRIVHMIGVPFAIDVIWVSEDTVTQTARLSPMTGIGRATADCIYELPAGNATGVSVGDTVTLESRNST